MNTVNKISLLMRALTLVIGLTTITISFFEYGIEEKIEKEFSSNKEQSDQTGRDDSNKDDPFYLPDYQATISSFQLHIDQTPKLQEYIPVITVILQCWPRDFSFGKFDFFKTLFQHIISPNAP